MKALTAFVNKEFKAHFRSGKIFALLGIFVVIGAMNPVTAKLTPWLLEILGESLEASGMNIVATTPTVLDSWMQFYKNIPMALIAFVAMESDIFTKEYRYGTLIIALTKGLNRKTVVFAKTYALSLLWTACYWLAFAVTYVINLCLWDVSLASHALFSASCWWLFGLMTVVLVVFFSTLVRSYIPVLLGTGGVAFAVYLVGALPKIGKYLPSKLLDGVSLVYGMSEPSDYVFAILLTAALCVALFAVSIPIFNKKEM